MLHVRQLIPPLTLRKASGSVVRARDFKQKKNLVIAFLDDGCPLCEQFIRSLITHAAALNGMEAVAMLVFHEAPASSLTNELPPEIVAGVDVGTQGARLYFGEDGLSTRERHRRAIFVTDRYGEISALWTVAEHEFPAIEEILRALDSVEMACEECNPPEWPRDE
jgi:peroxiredoxin